MCTQTILFNTIMLYNKKTHNLFVSNVTEKNQNKLLILQKKIYIFLNVQKTGSKHVKNKEKQLPEQWDCN